MKLVLTGINHRSAPVEIREKLAFDPATLPDALHTLRDDGHFEEGLILSTCNRVEVSVMSQQQDHARDRLLAFFERLRHVPPEAISPHIYSLEDREAVRHMFRVAAGLDSMILGEPQILGQLKTAYSVAKAEGMVRSALDPILTRAFAVAKRVRTETGIGNGAVSVSFAAVELAREIFGSLSRRSILLVGAGKMSELAAKHLHRAGAERIFVTNRTQSRAEEMAALFKGKAIPYDSFRNRLPDIDIVITSSAAPGFLLSRDQMAEVIRARRNRPMFLIDIAVPRNIAPDVNKVDNVFLYDIDDLQRVVEGNREERAKEAERAISIVDEEVGKLFSGLRTRAVGPAIVELQEGLETIRQAELMRMKAKLGNLTPEQMALVDQMTRSMMRKVAHGPIQEMRSLAAQEEDSALIGVLRKIFHIKGGPC